MLSIEFPIQRCMICPYLKGFEFSLWKINKNRFLAAMSSFFDHGLPITIAQHKISDPTMYNMTTFEEVRIFTIENLQKQVFYITKFIFWPWSSHNYCSVYISDRKMYNMTTFEEIRIFTIENLQKTGFWHRKVRFLTMVFS